MFNEYNDVMTVDEVCEALRIGRNTAYKLLQNGEIYSRKYGNKYFITKESIIDFLKAK